MQHATNTWGIVISNIADGTQPSTTPGTTITPGQNTYPAFTQILSATSDETFYMRVQISGVGVPATSKNALLKIGIDFGGGATYTDMTISDLVVSAASPVGSSTGNLNGVVYEFPIRVPAGATVAASCSVNNATVGNAYVWIQLFGKPSHPELIRYGSFVRTFGVTGASSSGTAFTPGVASEGAYSASLGTTADDLWAWEVGVCLDSTVYGNAGHYTDVAVSDDSGTTKRNVIQNAIWVQSTNEYIGKPTALSYAEVKSGATLYIRDQTQGGGTTNFSGVIYGVGG